MKDDLLTLMITPAVLISACGLMVLSTTNRYARVIDRIREIDRILAELLRQSRGDECRGRIHLSHRQLDVLGRRGRLLHRAMMCLVGAVAAFVSASLSTLVSFIWLSDSIVLPLALVIVGMLVFLFGTIGLMMEVRLSFRVTEEEIKYTKLMAPPAER